MHGDRGRYSVEDMLVKDPADSHYARTLVAVEDTCNKVVEHGMWTTFKRCLKRAGPMVWLSTWTAHAFGTRG